MVFKNFRVQLILRVLLLTTCIVVLSWCLMHGLYLRSVYLAVAAIFIVIELIRYVDSFNRDVKTFMLGLMQHDFTTRFQTAKKGRTFNDLYETLNDITHVFRTISTEKEIQYRYLEMLVEHLQVGIISYTKDEKIQLINPSLKKILNKNVLPNLKAIQLVDENLARTIRDISAGETRLVKLTVGNELLQLSVHASEFFLEHDYYKLVSLQNIRPELDAREMEAWQKLIRVLTHEIMNSVSPITSLSATLHGLVTQNKSILTDADPALFNSLDKGLEAVKIRSEGLHGFTKAYRQLTRIPEPKLRRYNIKELVTRVYNLLLPKLAELHVHCKLSLTDAEATVDPELMEHVFINIVQNAIEAVARKQEPLIEISNTVDGDGNVIVTIHDNGEGMDAETMDKIFIPFFTTKTQGSGIGLALSKQILQLHKADIKVSSEPGVGSTFVLKL